MAALPDAHKVMTAISVLSYNGKIYF